MLKAIHAQESLQSAQEKATKVVASLTDMKMKAAAELIEEKIDETLTYLSFSVNKVTLKAGVKLSEELKYCMQVNAKWQKQG